MDLVEITGIGYVEMTHEVLKICLRGFHDHMKMVGHENKGKQMDLIDLQRTFKDFQESFSVMIGKKDALPCVSSAGDVVTCILVLNTKRAGHGKNVSEGQGNVKDKDLTPLPPNQGEFGTGDYEEIMSKASCLSLVSTAILYWNTLKINSIIDSLRQHGESIDDETLQHISLLPFKHVLPNGTYFIEDEQGIF